MTQLCSGDLALRTRSRRRGIAMIDFVAGTIILAGAVAAWVALTRAQLDSVAFADRRQQARNACARALDDARAEGSEAFASELGKPEPDGFLLVRRFAASGLPSTSQELPGRLDARPLKADKAYGLYEVRATVRWKNPQGWEECELSTVVGPK